MGRSNPAFKFDGAGIPLQSIGAKAMNEDAEIELPKVDVQMCDALRADMVDWCKKLLNDGVSPAIVAIALMEISNNLAIVFMGGEATAKILRECADITMIREKKYRQSRESMMN
jgi:hypothetical protein